MADYTIGLQRADDAAYSSGAADRAFKVLGASFFSVPMEGPVVGYGAKGINSTGRTIQIVLVMDYFGVTAPESQSNMDFGDLRELEDIIFSPYFRIILTGTDLERTNGSANFWDTLLTAGAYSVVRESYSPSTSFEDGTDRVTVTLRGVDPIP